MSIYSYKNIVAESAEDAYLKMCKLLEDEGHLVESRNEPTKEVLNVSVEIKNPLDRVIMIEKTKLPFMFMETYDILNSNDPRIKHSDEQLKKTMGDSKDLMFFGNEMRQAFSKFSLMDVVEKFKKDKFTRKAVLSLGNRHMVKHHPCLLFAHFIIRDDKFYMTVETRGSAISMGFIQDVFFMTFVQEILLGWLKEFYPELEMGSFVYKTISMHEYINIEDSLESGKYTYLWNQDLTTREGDPKDPFRKIAFSFENKDRPYLNMKEYILEMGVLSFYVEQYMKAVEYEDIDNGKYILKHELKPPIREVFFTEVFYNWALGIYEMVTK